MPVRNALDMDLNPLSEEITAALRKHKIIHPRQAVVVQTIEMPIGSINLTGAMIQPGSRQGPGINELLHAPDTSGVVDAALRTGRLRAGDAVMLGQTGEVERFTPLFGRGPRPMPGADKPSRASRHKQKKRRALRRKEEK